MWVLSARSDPRVAAPLIAVAAQKLDRDPGNFFRVDRGRA
jgi:hypothetical protein